MTQNLTVLDRYIAFSDRAVGRPELIEELRTIFSEDATVQLIEDKFDGIDAILDFYRKFIDLIEEGTHYWTTTEVGEGVLEARWIAAVRFKGDRLVATGGLERAQVNSAGLITNLRNYPNEGLFPVSAIGEDLTCD